MAKDQPQNISEMKVPRHIAIILDGNGRWAEQRGLPRPEGHVRGSAIVESIVEAASQYKIERLTLYCFSSENWKRPQEEVDALMQLLKFYLTEQRATLMKNNIRLRVVGRREGIPKDVLETIDQTLDLTAENTGLTLALAVNYGSRAELVDATRAMVVKLLDPQMRQQELEKAGVTSIEELIDENYIASHLYESDAPDPDLFIRTGGEQRLSNYLLWQLSYAELWFTDVLWPDFSPKELAEALRWYQARQRRFGGLIK